eukprot:5468540-Alexandrium_andersonii.AAC.1
MGSNSVPEAIDACSCAPELPWSSLRSGGGSCVSGCQPYIVTGFRIQLSNTHVYTLKPEISASVDSK